MSTISRRLEQTVVRVRALGDGGILGLTEQIGQFERRLERRLRKLVYLRWLARMVLLAAVSGSTTAVWMYVKFDPGLSVEVTSWNEAFSLAADLAELGFLLLPIVISMFLIERVLERTAILSMLSQLELFTDSVYDEQFDDNPYKSAGGKAGVTDDWLLECLDCCAALLFIIRMLAQRVAGETGDRTILEQCGVVRRGAGDNHTRILIKIGILKALKAPLQPEALHEGARELLALNDNVVRS